MSKNKTPRVDPRVQAKSLSDKVPKGQPPEKGSFDHYRPVICLSHVDRDGPFSWKGIRSRELHLVVNKLHGYFANTWQQLLYQNEHYFHAIETSRLSRPARERLIALRLEELDVVYDVRITKPIRIWLARLDHYAFPLWWDPKHLVYPTK